MAIQPTAAMSFHCLCTSLLSPAKPNLCVNKARRFSSSCSTTVYV